MEKGTSRMTDKEFEEWKFRYCCISALYRYYHRLKEADVLQLKPLYQRYIPTLAEVSSHQENTQILKKWDKKIAAIKKIFEFDNPHFSNEIIGLGAILNTDSLKVDISISTVDQETQKQRFLTIHEFHSIVQKMLEGYRSHKNIEPDSYLRHEPVKFELLKMLVLGPPNLDEAHQFIFESKIEEKFCKELFSEDYEHSQLVGYRAIDTDKKTAWKGYLIEDLAGSLTQHSPKGRNPFRSPYNPDDNIQEIILEKGLLWTPEEFKFEQIVDFDEQNGMPLKYDVGDEWFKNNYGANLSEVFRKAAR